MELTLVDIIGLILLLLLMLGLGSSIDVVAFKNQFRRPKKLLIGMFLQFVLQPPLAVIVGKAWGLPPVQAVSLVVTCSCPGGSMSNIICLLFRADVDLSVAMTAASSLAALFMLPFNLYVYGSMVEGGEGMKMDFASVLLSCVVVITGTAGGYYVKSTNNEARVILVAKVGFISGLCIVAKSFFSNLTSDTPVYGADTNFITSCYTQILLTLGIGLSLSKVVFKLPGPSCMSIATETSTQNAIIALSILTLSLNSDDSAAASIIPIIYSSANTSTNILFGIFFWKVMGWSNVPKEATLKEMWKSYKELLAAENNGDGQRDYVERGNESGQLVRVAPLVEVPDKDTLRADIA
ncbi:hypothetical protein TrST_g8357 [Triparma strigata]|uniref:Sodium/bile acid cotransporter n=1 Tax=Triparma strigata TaxID=1606541 RepID=A0A9W7EK12_9STRA|nr:hypothetical protein TrST_g8357 [Triparma strigata]